MLNEILTSIGLSDKEGKMYLASLKYGTKPISFLAKKSGFNRGTGYVILHNLLELGLVTKSSKKGVLLFTAQPPEQLLSFLTNRQEELRSGERKVRDNLEKFRNLISPFSRKPKLEYFDGVSGARSALLDMFEAKDKKLRAFISLSDMAEFVGDKFLSDHTKRRIRAGYSIDVIRTKEKDREASKKKVFVRAYGTSKVAKRIVRFADASLSLPMTVYLYDDKVLALSSKEEGFAFIIRSREFSDMLKAIFGIVWVTSDEA